MNGIPQRFDNVYNSDLCTIVQEQPYLAKCVSYM